MSNPFDAGLSTSITWNGHDLRDFGLEIYTPAGRGVPAVIPATQRIPGVHGQLAWQQTLGPRTIRCRGIILGTSRADCLANLEGLKTLFRRSLFTGPLAGDTADGQAVGSARLVFQDQADRFWPAVYGGIFAPTEATHEWRNFQLLNVDLSFLCHQPFALATEPSFGESTGSGSRTTDRMVRCALGTAPSRPVVEIRGPATTPSVLVGDQLLHEDFAAVSGKTDWSGTDKITDPDMELSGIANWTAITATVTKSGDYAAHGSQSLKVVAAGADEGAKQTIAVSAAETYALVIHTLGDTAYVQIWDATAGAEVTQSTLKRGSTSYPAKFRRTATSFTVPAGCSSIEIRLLLTGAGTTYFDHVHMLETLTTNPDFSGTYAAGVAPNWTKTGAWTATEETSSYQSTGQAQGMEGANGGANALTQTHTLTAGKLYIGRLAARRVSGSGNLVVTSSAGTTPYLHRFDITTGAALNLRQGSFVFKPLTGGAKVFGIYQTDGSTKHVIDDFTICELSSGAVNRRLVNTVHGRGLDLPDGESILSWIAQDFLSDQWTVAIRFLPLFEYNAMDEREIFTIGWGTGLHARLHFSRDLAALRADLSYTDGGGQWEFLTSDTWPVTGGGYYEPSSVVLSSDGSTLKMWVDGTKQTTELSLAGSEDSSDQAEIYIGTAIAISHLVVLGRAVSDAEGSEISGSLTPPEDSTKTMSYGANLVAGDVLTLDFQKWTARKVTRSADTDVVSNVSGPWGELRGNESLIRLGAVAGGLRARWWKRWI